jgi:hypothetical protein
VNDSHCSVCGYLRLGVSLASLTVLTAYLGDLRLEGLDLFRRKDVFLGHR